MASRSVCESALRAPDSETGCFVGSAADSADTASYLGRSGLVAWGCRAEFLPVEELHEMEQRKRIIPPLGFTRGRNSFFAHFVPCRRIRGITGELRGIITRWLIIDVPPLRAALRRLELHSFLTQPIPDAIDERMAGTGLLDDLGGVDTEPQEFFDLLAFLQGEIA